MNKFDILLDRILDLRIAYEAIAFEVELLNLKGVKCNSLRDEATFKLQTIEKLEEEARLIAPKGFDETWFTALANSAKRSII